MWFPAGMANILGDEQRQQILVLGRLGWPLRGIEQAIGIRRETASAYLKAAGIAIRAPRLGKPASEVSTDFGGGWPSPAITSMSLRPGPSWRPASPSERSQVVY